MEKTKKTSLKKYYNHQMGGKTHMIHFNGRLFWHLPYYITTELKQSLASLQRQLASLAREEEALAKEMKKFEAPRDLAMGTVVNPQRAYC